MEEDIVQDEFQDSESAIYCRICGRQAKIITPGHLKSHSITMADYRKKFPEAPLVCGNTTKKLTQTAIDQANKTKKLKEQSLLNEIQKSPTIENLPKKSIEEENIVKKIDNLLISNIVNNESTFKNKAEIINYLEYHFGSGKVHNNYYVEKYIVQQLLEYKIITDIAIPSLKIDFEFPKSFWHNYDVRRPKDLRDSVLRRDGWTVIDINSVNPNCEDLRGILDTLPKKIK